MSLSTITGAAAPRRRTGPALTLMTLPALLLFGAFALVPLVGVIVLSFMTWDGLGTPTWSGISNWTRTLADPITANAIWVTLVVMIASWLFQTPISLLLGIFAAGHQKYRAVLSVLYFIPLLLSSAAIAIAFRALLDPNFGLGAAWSFFAQNWLGDPVLAVITVVFVISWQFIPFHTLIYTAGVRQIPQTLFEAAMLDGATAWQRFRFITLPQLKYTIITSSTLMLVGSLTYFDLIFVLTGGGPGISTRVLALDMYLRGFRSYDMGGASVIAVILMVAGLILATVLNRASGANRMTSQSEG